MSFLKKFQYHYHDKNIENILKTGETQELINYLEKISPNQKLFYSLSLKYISSAINKSSADLFKNKILWVNSFLKEDSSFISQFLEFYINHTTDFKPKPTDYLNEIASMIIANNNLDFNTLVRESYFFQWLILNKYKIPLVLVNNYLPFFSTERNFNFTKQCFTQSYIFVLNHPYAVYEKIKEINSHNQDLAKNIFLNLDNQMSLENISSKEFQINKQGWHTNTRSWLDPNVLNSLNGKYVTIKALQENAYEVLSSIVLHLIQSGLKINLDYKIIEDYLKSHPLPKQTQKNNLSQKEIKFLDKYVENIIQTYDL